MIRRIVVRLPEELVGYVDSLVAQGAASRSAVVAHAVNLYRQQMCGDPDVRILERSGDYDDFDELVRSWPGAPAS